MKALLYARVSKENQGAFSIETQLQKCRKQAEILGADDIEIYVDSGLTADVDRPGFNNMLADYQAGDIIIALSSDRLFSSFSQAKEFNKQYRLQLVLPDEDELRPAEQTDQAQAATEPAAAGNASKPDNKARQLFLAHIAGLIDFWDREPKSSREKLEGLAVSILGIYDGWAEEISHYLKK